MADQAQGVLAPPAQVQAGQQAKQQQHQQDHIAPPVQDPTAQKQGQQVVHLNWSYFKPEFSGKPDKDAETNLLHTNDWMNAHHFIESVKVQRFCLTLLGEARLWYHSLEPINVDCQGLQNLFRQQYSKIGNTREQLFHVWRSFSFNENTETIDAYVTCIRQVATLLGYGEPQILEVFKKPLPTKLYWILILIEDLRHVVEIAKRILTKEKLDRQLTGQSLSTPFMSIRDGHNRKVSFDTKEELGDKIDKLAVMVGKLATRDSGTSRQFKPQFHQNRGRGQNRNYNQRNYPNRYRSHSSDRGQCRQHRGRPRYKQNYRRGHFMGNVSSYGRQNCRGGYRNNYRNDRYNRQNSRRGCRNNYRIDSYDRSKNRSRERSFSRNYSNNSRNRSASNSRSRSGSRASTNRDRIQCYKCREYDHFTKDCPTSREEKEIEQLQQMLNLGDEQTSLTLLISNMQDNFSITGSEENLRQEHLNL